MTTITSHANPYITDKELAGAQPLMHRLFNAEHDSPL